MYTMSRVEAGAAATTIRRERLNRDRVLRAAVALADESGIGAVSMRGLAKDLGVVPMALYKHVADKDELLDGMVDVVIGEFGPADPAQDWKGRIRQRILAARRAVLRHPWARPVIESRTNRTLAVLGYMDSLAGEFRAGGFSADLTHHVMHALGNRIWGFSPELFEEPRRDDQAPGPQADDPQAPGPRADDPRAAGPRAGDPRAGDRQAPGPRAGDRQAAGDPRAGDPRAGDPRAGDPRAGDPRAGDPRAPGPQAAGPQADHPRAPGPRADDRQAPGPQADHPRAPGPQAGHPQAAGPRASGVQGQPPPDPEAPEALEAMAREYATRFPNILAIALAATGGDLTRVGAGCDEQFEFEFALDLLLDGAERLHHQGWQSPRANPPNLRSNAH
jgi:AcrR family transcriptional regulator